MALFERNPGRRPSSSYSTATFIVFVALVLVGVWMLTSSTFTPVSMTSANDKSQTDEPVQETRQEDTNTGTDNSETPFNENENDKGENENIEKLNEETKGESESIEKLNEETKGESESIEKLNEETKGENENKEETKGDGENKNNEDFKGEDENKGENENYGKNNEDTKGENENNGNNNEDTKGENENNGNNEDTKGENDNNGNNEETTKGENENNGGEDTSKGENENNGGEDNTTKGENENIQTKFDDENGKIEGGGEVLKQEESETQNKNQETEDTQKIEETTNESTNTTTDNFPNGAQSELLNESTASNGTFTTQAAESTNEKKAQEEVEKEAASGQGEEKDSEEGVGWKLCTSSAGADYIPCLDNEVAIKKLKSTKHYEHRERHCPEEPPVCLVQLPEGYKRPIDWPHSRDKIWYHNVPHTSLADVKGHQNWVKVSGEYLSFPGGGTQFKNGALHYIDNIQESFPDIAWGKKTRVILDVGCGVASLGGFLFERDVLTMSFAPKDEHEAQVQFALERGIPAISAVMGTKRLPYPSLSFDVVHCARCRVPWHIEGGKLLLELNRLLRPGGYFVWSATPVYQKLEEDVEIWNAMSELMELMCWKMVKKTKDTLNKVGLAIYQKPSDNNCYSQRPENSTPPMCQTSDDPNAAWNVSLQACMHKIPEKSTLRGAQWPAQWPERLEKAPYWLNGSGVYGKPAPLDFEADFEHWKHVVGNSYVNGMGIDWTHVRNVMDMRAVYGGFAAALRDMKVWVMNVVPIDSPDTLPIIYERGLFGIYHDWCESFSTYPRSYDLVHADHLFSRIKNRCKILPVMAEVDRILRPEGKLIVRDNIETINEIEKIAKSLKYETRMTFSKEKEGLLCVQKTMWRPSETDVPLS